MCTSPAVELSKEPRPPARRHPHTLHRDFGGAALEVELEEGFRAAAVDDLDPGVGSGGLVLDDFDDGVGFAALALEVEPVTVAFALTDGSRDDGHAVGQPLGHAARVRDEVEDVLDGDADGAGIRQRDWTHGHNMAAKGGRGANGGIAATGCREAKGG